MMCHTKMVMSENVLWVPMVPTKMVTIEKRVMMVLTKIVTSEGVLL